MRRYFLLGQILCMLLHVVGWMKGVLYFNSFLLFLLIFHVFPYSIFVKTHSTDKIATSPKMVAPRRFLSQLWIAHEKLYGNLALQGSHQQGNRKFRRDKNQQMYVVVLNV